MSRIQALMSAALLVCLAACEGETIRAPGLSAGGRDAEQLSPARLALSPAARQVSHFAGQGGDRDYLMIDKARGEIIVFQNGEPTFSGSALTGQNPSDHMPEDAWAKPFAQLRGLKYKITPAGRYTVSSGHDPAYGKTLDINEVRGADWDVAIHKVWLGAPAERREERLRSRNGPDKQITYGCIDVDAATMQQVLKRLPGETNIPIYIVPVDESLIGKMFQPRAAMGKTPDPSG
jgi:hypothetical protein